MNPCSLIIDDKYWLACTLIPSTTNNIVLVYDTDDDYWTIFNSTSTYWQIRALGYYKYRPYMCSARNDGFIYRYDEDLDTDNGEAFTPYFKTKAFNMGLLNQDKTLEDLWIYSKNSDNYTDVLVDYYINKSTTTENQEDIDISGDNDPTITRLLRPRKRFRQLELEITNFDTFYGFDVYYKFEPKGPR